MIRNYVVIAFRNFGREKVYTVLNVIGLSLGMAACLLIVQYVAYEKSFDTFHSRAGDIYRLQYNNWQNGQLSFESAVAVPAAGAALKQNFPEVEAHTRFLPSDGVVKYEAPGQEPIAFREERIHFADTSLFTVFDFKLLSGNAKTCLKALNTVIVSKSTAKKYFKSDDPIGKRLQYNGDMPLEVTGVFDDVPENSHIKFDFLISYATLNALTKNSSETSWGWYDFYCFVLLKPGTDVKALQAKWDAYLARVRKDDWEKQNEKQAFILRPLTDIHLYSNLLYETSPQDLRDGDSVHALSIIALFIMFIAWVNYVNLATARSLKRAGEVGVRKVVGAFRGQLITQFLTESLLLNLIAVGLALAIVRGSWPSFAALTGWNIPLDFFYTRNFWLLVAALFVMGAVCSGFYPAIVLSSFKPISVLKGKFISSTRGNYLRKGLVVFQFAASVFLISGSLIVYQQLQYMKTLDLGVNIDQTLVLKGPSVTDSLYLKNYETFKTEVLRIKGVKGISASSSIPGEENYWTGGITRLSGGPEGALTVTTVALDQEHIPQYGITVVAGRNFDRRFISDNKKVLINESLAKALAFKDPAAAVDEWVRLGRDTFQIAGVLEDYHQMSLKAKVIPVVFRFAPSAAFYSLKLETDNYHDVLQALDVPWKQTFPGNPMDYFFLDQFFNRQYDRDDRFGQVFTLFTALAIFIASLGLLGLASFMTLQRTKEIGIRKVLGSTVPGIIVLLSKGFLQPVMIAIVLACPLGWWLMHHWLESFPYHTHISLWTFAISGAIVLMIAFVSVISQTLKAALTKPAETLKCE
ncbi:ABC transporter permease [Chryseolinea sp. Jin1]|uniref:ABC transporter permease n=2 Tax=Chryseolinea lacunae TaxID=2801331 RepID=A0ABS1KYC7_9BACT|nr:ABC transporter permease [Chryseolinea lacunae]